MMKIIQIFTICFGVLTCEAQLRSFINSKLEMNGGKLIFT